MSNEISKMLNAEDKGVEEATGVLSRLFRQILVDINLTPLGWSELMHKYLTNPRNGIPRNSRDRSTARGNLNKELRRPDMTWKIFRKALNFLGPKKITFEVHLEWRNNKTTVHSVKLDTGQLADEPDGVDQDD